MDLPRRSPVRMQEHIHALLLPKLDLVIDEPLHIFVHGLSFRLTSGICMVERFEVIDHLNDWNCRFV
jgi:hypothetical protein